MGRSFFYGCDGIGLLDTKGLELTHREYARRLTMDPAAAILREQALARDRERIVCLPLADHGFHPFQGEP